MKFKKITESVSKIRSKFVGNTPSAADFVF
jgi:hypothetical protein